MAQLMRAEEERLLGAVRGSRVTVLTASCGFGKSTLVPPLLCRAFPGKLVLCTQPRRLAATMLAERVSRQNADLRVSHAVRFDSDWTPASQLVYLTEGVLLARFDGLDLGNAVFCLDEAHELSGPLVVLCWLLKRNLLKTFKILVLSATLNAGAFVRYFSTRAQRPSALDFQRPLAFGVRTLNADLKRVGVEEYQS